MIYLDDHRPALLATGASLGTAAIHSMLTSDIPHNLEMLRFWLGVGGQVAGILSGLAALTWYAYSIYKKSKDNGSETDQ